MRRNTYITMKGSGKNGGVALSFEERGSVFYMLGIGSGGSRALLEVVGRALCVDNSSLCRKMLLRERSPFSVPLRIPGESKTWMGNYYVSYHFLDTTPEVGGLVRIDRQFISEILREKEGLEEEKRSALEGRDHHLISRDIAQEIQGNIGAHQPHELFSFLKSKNKDELKEEIMKMLVMSEYGCADYNYIFVLFTTGGGTGSGSAPVILELLHEVLSEIGAEYRLIAVPILPFAQEPDVRRFFNTVFCLCKLVELARNGVIDMILMVSNEAMRKVARSWPWLEAQTSSAMVSQEYADVNLMIAELFETIAAHVSVDMDFTNIINCVKERTETRIAVPCCFVMPDVPIYDVRSAEEEAYIAIIRAMDSKFVQFKDNTGKTAIASICFPESVSVTAGDMKTRIVGTIRKVWPSLLPEPYVVTEPRDRTRFLLIVGEPVLEERYLFKDYSGEPGERKKAYESIRKTHELLRSCLGPG